MMDLVQFRQSLFLLVACCGRGWAPGDLQCHESNVEHHHTVLTYSLRPASQQHAGWPGPRTCSHAGVPDILEVQPSTVKLPRLCNVRVGDDWLACVDQPGSRQLVAGSATVKKEPDRSGLCWWFLD
ncbi:hypothetical protein V2G26_013800 [Clonostachys chloroleuca]